MFGVQNSYDEVDKFTLGRYIGANEAFWKIFAFPIHASHPAIIPLTVHLENGQRVTFTKDTAATRLENPKPTTLTGFFTLCDEDSFAETI